MAILFPFLALSAASHPPDVFSSRQVIGCWVRISRMYESRKAWFATWLPC